jgi:TRAP-type C4-dicarboxylate transport system permease large subunit
VNAPVHAIIPLLLPVIIFGSIFTGAATVTESAVLAVVYAWIVGMFIYRETPCGHLPSLCLGSGIVSAASWSSWPASSSSRSSRGSLSGCQSGFWA